MGQGMTISDTLAGFVTETQYEDIPKEVIKKSKLCILDTIGCALLGTRSRWTHVLERYLRQMGGGEKAHVIGLPHMTSAPNAAFANGILTNVDDLDDIRLKFGHPSIVVLPAALALAETDNSSGKDFLMAFAIGWEVAVHLGETLSPWHPRSWYSTTTMGIFGAAAAACKVMKLDREQICWALGMAACQSAGLRASFGSMVRELQIGQVGLLGVIDAMMANLGVSASRDIFERLKGGFLQVYTDNAPPEVIPPGLGNPWKMLKPGVGFKRYPCCSHTHNGIEAVLALRSAHSFQWDEIACLKILTDPAAFDILVFDRPRDAYEAKYSMPFCIALAIAEGDVIPSHFTDDKAKDPVLLSLMERVKMEVDPEIARKGYLSTVGDTTVSITLKDGREFSNRVRIPYGHPERPFSEEELRDKFLKCTSHILPQKNALKCLEVVHNLEHLSRMTKLGSLISSPR
jgi:2-methylcitrate dehydratase PrpD